MAPRWARPLLLLDLYLNKDMKGSNLEKPQDNVVLAEIKLPAASLLKMPDVCIGICRSVCLR